MLDVAVEMRMRSFRVISPRNLERCATAEIGQERWLIDPNCRPPSLHSEIFGANIPIQSSNRSQCIRDGKPC